ncbi:unnamed protein product [Fusarium graminearum]|uniref:Uncharacterized protein n=1 Tax=Gibberella zeae TaxID=5518 RepID=A0A9N8RQZ6_GIBZA|nr:unnamed protein product [Fusarium graminearum]
MSNLDSQSTQKPLALALGIFMRCIAHCTPIARAPQVAAEIDSVGRVLMLELQVCSVLAVLASLAFAKRGPWASPFCIIGLRPHLLNKMNCML